MTSAKAEAVTGRRAIAGAKAAAAVGAGLLAANCSGPQVASQRGPVVDPKYGVVASPRVIEDGEPVPKGGGRAMVGRPYQVAGKTYVPRDNPRYAGVGLASWYGAAFHGRLTANGEIFDRQSVAAAHPTMPLPSYARITNLHNQRSMIVRVNDRGPYHPGRIVDVSEKAAQVLDFKRIGTARVRVEYVGRASTRGSDDDKLLATLRTDGAPAPFPGMTSPTLVATAEPVPARAAVLSAESVVARAPVAAGVPLPPERPFDLGTIPGAATPVAMAPVALLPPARPATSSLFFAAPEADLQRLAEDDPFRHLREQRFVSLSSKAGQPSRLR